MLRVIKKGQIAPSDQVVKIPDYSPPPKEEEMPLEDMQVEEVKDSAQIAEELARQKAIETAEDISQKILKSASLERDKILEQANVERTRLREEAQQQGYQDAYQQLKGEITGCLAQVESMLDEMQQRQREFIRHYEEDLRFLAIDIAEKILRKRIDEDDSVMVEMIKQAVSTVKNADWISVEVSDKLPGLVERLKKEFAAQAGEKMVEVSAQDTEPGSCVLNMPGAIVDVSISAQLENLREVFKDI